MSKEKKTKNKIVKESQIPDEMVQPFMCVYAMIGFPGEISVSSGGKFMSVVKAEIPADFDDAWDMLIEIAAKIKLLEIFCKLHKIENGQTN